MKFFINNIYMPSFTNNDGGMGAPDLFSLWNTFIFLNI